jgi:DNA repair protein RecN (Recombination protein N)
LVEIDAALAALGGDQRSRAREIDLLRFQLGELSDAAISEADEDERLSAEEDTLADAAAHREAGQLAVDALTGSVEGVDGAPADRPVADAFGVALRAIAGRAPFDEYSVRLEALAAETTELGRDLRAFTEALDEDPERLAEIRQRRQLLHDMRRKYGESLADVIAFHEEARQRLSELESYDERVAALERDRESAVKAERTAAATVAKIRKAGASKLGTAVRDVVRSLAMPHAEVDVVVGDEAPGDDVAFLIAANPGLPMLPLSRVASGGELARTMLALRLVLTEAPETLVFDEVDAGIGGAAATAVAEALARLGRRHQVMVVTHLAQVAALADSQIVVTKTVSDGPAGETTTVARARAVDGDERIDEIARMLSGEQAGASARRHAADLLDERLRLS